MKKINEYIADLVRLHMQLKIDGQGEIPVVQLYDDGDHMTLRRGVLDPAYRIMTAKQVHNFLASADEVEIPDWLNGYEGDIIVL